MKSICYLVGLIMFLNLNACEAKEVVRFEKINNSLPIEISSPKKFVFSDKSNWKNFLKKFNILTYPEIDFNKYTIIAIFIGVKPNAGYGVEIISIEQIGGEIYVKFNEYLPDPNEGYIQVITYPYDIVLFPKLTGKIIFVKINNIKQ